MLSNILRNECSTQMGDTYLHNTSIKFRYLELNNN
jgi:hypothetical protein